MSDNAKIRNVVRSMSVEEIAKLKINLSVSAIAILLSASLSAIGTGGVMLWNASSRWTAFQEQQAKRDKDIAEMVAIVGKHDQTIPQIEQRQRDLEVFCCPSLRAAVQSAVQTVAPAMVTR